MSEKQEHSGDPETGNLVGIRQSGLNGERRSGGADERSSSEKANEHSTPQQVSRETSRPEKNKRSPVYVYLAVLFGAAFLMLLLAYFIQQRNNETTISGLQSSWNLSREELMQENDRLEEENEALTARIAELEEQLEFEQGVSDEFHTMYDGARNQASHLSYYLVQRSQAMELLWQLEKAYAQGSRQLCLELIGWLESPEANPLKNYLPTADDREQYDYGLDRPTPAERYQEIYEKLS